ncbi:hypothetical protein [Aquimarina celericrescens]|uniref:Co-chaperone DjlA N-terminal domain-containing protein n=1 Tax=Aquimarina celericrescens TaxID=1964542 RepID=A0ABW5AS38_9FLAO
MMFDNLKNNLAFYQKLAHLFYAIAMADKKMVIEEKKKIVLFVKKYWSTNLENSHTEEIIYETLRSLIKNKTTADEAFNTFKTYCIENKDLFTDEMVKKIIETSDAIAIAFGRGRNKSELILLTKLTTLFQK